MTKPVFRVAKMVRGYPLTSAGPYRVYGSRPEVLQALGPHEACHGDYAGTFNPRHPAATDYYIIARSIRDPHLVAVTDTPEGSPVTTEDTPYNTRRARVGDIISVTIDGRAYDMTVWRIDAPGTAGTSYAAGPHVAAWIRPGGYGVTLDAGNVDKYSARLVTEDTPAPEDIPAYRLQRPYTASPEHVAADKDHTPAPVSAYGDEIGDYCSKCGLAVTADGKHHGFSE